MLSRFGLAGLLCAPQFPDAVCDRDQHGQARYGNARSSSCTGQGQHVGEDQHSPKAHGANAEKDGGGRRDATGGRLVGRRPRPCPYGSEMASGPFVLGGEYDQGEKYHEKARSGCRQEYHANGEDHGAHDGDGDPAEKPD